MTLSNIYGPNNDDPIFFEHIYESIENLPNDNRIVVGDFNNIMNPLLDKQGGRPDHSNTKARAITQNYIDEFEMFDVFRKQHPETKQYTFHTPSPNVVFTRLDFYLVSFGLLTLCDLCEIVPGYLSDHSFVKLKLRCKENIRGKGFWKMNCLYLNDPEYTRQICQTIQNTIEGNGGATPQLLWDTMKMNIRGKSIQFCAHKKRCKVNLLTALEKRLRNLQCAYVINQDTDTLAIIQEIKNDIDEIMTEKTKGSILRCKMQWHEEGEKSTKYFLNLEKRQYNKKNISRLKKENGDIISDNNEILNEQKSFYEQLYTTIPVNYSEPNIKELETKFFEHEDENYKLNNEERDDINGKFITETEIKQALDKMKNGKTPGNDGIPREFYIAFWHDIKKSLMDSINYALQVEELSLTQRRGTITLLPKKEKDPLLLKNWRPISLLNTDYKLITTVIAHRIKKFLTKIIHADQTGFIKGRYIGENILNIIQLMDYCEENDISGLFVTVDFEKAFDYLEWSFVEKSLNHFNFGENIIHWVKIIYNNISSCILNNGWYSPFFTLSRGMRQGCPLSPYLFIISAEILSTHLRDNDKIKGIHVQDIEHKVNQYADDTALTLQYCEESINELIKSFISFQQISGLKINKEKTYIMPFGPVKHNYEILLPELGLQWGLNPVQYLGVKITSNKNELITLNYEPIVHKITLMTRIWKQRDLTIFGKSTIIKSLLVSQLTFLLSVLPSPPTDYFDRINYLLFNFLWNNKPDKIKRHVLYNIKAEGGLGMTHLASQNQALKIAWVKRYLTDPFIRWKQFFDLSSLIPIKELLSCNLNIADANEVFDNVACQFTKNVFISWFGYTYEINNAEDESQNIYNQFIWYNSKIKVNGNVLFYRAWYERNIKYIKDLLIDYKFMSHAQFQACYNLNVNFVTYYGLLSSIPCQWKRFIKLNEHPGADNNMTEDNNVLDIMRTQKVCRYVYPKIICNVVLKPEKPKLFWSTTFDHVISGAEWSDHFKKMYLLTTSPKLLYFHYRLLHNILPCNVFLFKIGIVGSPDCSFCKNEPETLEHLFIHCPIIQIFWVQFEQMLNNFDATFKNYEPYHLLLSNIKTPEIIIDLLYLLAKQYIYTCRVNDNAPHIQCFMQIIKKYRTIEENIALKNDKLTLFLEKWRGIIP